MPKLVDSERSKLRLQVAAAAMILAVALTFIAVRFQSKDYLISKTVKTRLDRTYSRVWFTAEDTLVGSRQVDAHLSIHRWAEGNVAERTWELDLQGSSDEPTWAIAPDLSHIAWIADASIQSATIPEGNGTKLTPIAIKVTERPLAFTILSDGSLAAAFADSSVKRWNAATGDLLGEQNLNLQKLDQVAALGDYIAVAPAHASRLVLYRFRDAKEWVVVDDTTAPDPPYQIILPAPGFMATLSSGRLRVGTLIRNSPGPVRSAVSHLDNMIATGDFEKAFVLPEDEPAYFLANAVPGSVVATGDSHMAISGPQGTTLLDLDTETRLTAGGRATQWVSAGLAILAGMLACVPLLLATLLSLVHRMLRGKKKKGHELAPAKLADPPLELLQACASGQSVLWAGAGLSAQSGIPLRTNFIANILQTAQVEKWVQPAQARKLMGLFASGDGEGALTHLVASTAPFRGQLIAHVRATIPTFAVSSRSHELLWRIPFFSAVTSSYDNLLERSGQPWSFNVLTLRSQAPDEGVDFPFLMKLYGDLSMPPSVLLSRGEFESAIPFSPVKDLIRSLFNARSIMFVGCSLKGLLADLNALGVAIPTKRHFAVVGVSGDDWPTQSAELSRRFGIEVILCDAVNISAALPEFLDKLVRGVDELAGQSREETVKNDLTQV